MITAAHFIHLSIIDKFLPILLYSVWRKKLSIGWKVMTIEKEIIMLDFFYFILINPFAENVKENLTETTYFLFLKLATCLVCFLAR